VREQEAQLVLLVRAVEASDPEGRLVPLEDRRKATEAAKAATPGGVEGEILAARAEHLVPVLEARIPGVLGLLRATRFGSGLAPLVAIGAFVLGLSSNVLGPRREISVLQGPLLAVILWNLFVYALLVVLPWLRRPKAAEPAGWPSYGSPGRGRGLASRAIDAVVSRFASRARKRDAQAAILVSTAVTRYAADWRRASTPLLASRVRLWLHLGSLCLVLGVVVGMYVRGLGFRYETTWESTFLDASTMESFLRFVLGPASALLGIPVPALGDPYLHHPTAGPAAPWIHLYAGTALLYVGGPRLLLAAFEARRAVRLARTVPAAIGYADARRAGLSPEGAPAAVEVLPYSHTPTPRACDALLAVLHDVFGTGTPVRVADSLAYGTEAGDLPALATGARRVLLFSLAQTPETEVHGRFLAACARVAPGAPPVVLVDGSGYRERAADATRLTERRRLWDRIANEAGGGVVHVDLGLPEGDARVERVARAAGLGPSRGRGA